MTKYFERLSEEKKKKIIDACLEEFGNNGYEKASTNAIVKKAGISKGLLFHYFGSKKAVFLYTIDYAIDYMLNWYEEISKDKPSDLFERMMWGSLQKLKMWHEEPLIFKVGAEVYLSSADGLKDELINRYIKIRDELLPEFFKDVDTSKLRKGVDPKKAIEIVILFLEGLSNRYIDRFRGASTDELYNNMEKLMAEINEYFDILKGGIYQT